MRDEASYNDDIAYTEAKAEARGKAEGVEIGKAEGKAEGRAEGKAESKVEIAIALKKSGVAVEIIAQATGLTIAQIDVLVIPTP